MAENRKDQKSTSNPLDLNPVPTLNREHDALHEDKMGLTVHRRPAATAAHTPPALNREIPFRQGEKGNVDNALTKTLFSGVKNGGSKAHRRPAVGANYIPPALKREDAFRK